MPQENRLLSTYRTLSRLPLGKRMFTTAFQLVAPYFATIPAHVDTMESGLAIVTMRDWPTVRNHLGTVHAIALCNLAELTMGVAAEATVPTTHRWIPKGMNVEYLAKAKGTMRATATASWPADPADRFELPFEVAVRDSKDKEVFHATIRLWISENPKR